MQIPKRHVSTQLYIFYGKYINIWVFDDKEIPKWMVVRCKFGKINHP
jgi:hypothetical protein